MAEYYHENWSKARLIEGASQRVQEDTLKFSRIMESLGTSLIEALMILIEFTPILFGLSLSIPIFFFGDWDYGLIVGALIWSIGGTIFLVILGLILRLVGVEYDLQKKEAAYRIYTLFSYFTIALTKSYHSCLLASFVLFFI